MSVTFTDNADEVLDALEDAIHRAAERIVRENFSAKDLFVRLKSLHTTSQR